MRIFFITSITLACAIFAQDQESDLNIDLHVTVEKTYRLANDGNHDEAMLLWRMGNFIDKFENIRKIAPLSKRVILLEKAARAGHAEACFSYAIYLLYDMNDKNSFLEFIKKSSEKKHIMGTVTLSIITAFHKRDQKKSKDLLNGINNLPLAFQDDVFDRKINTASLDLLKKSIEKNDLDYLKNESENKQELQLLDCIRLYEKYAGNLPLQ